MTSSTLRTTTITTSDGVRLVVDVEDAPGVSAGDPTVVLVHGFGHDTTIWAPQRAALLGRHRLVLPDQRGHGRSEPPPPGSATIERLGRDLGEVLDAVVPDSPAVLVGHSMGGMAILALARARPGLFGAPPAPGGGPRVNGVALICSAAGDALPGRRPIAGIGPLEVVAGGAQRLSRAATRASQALTGAALTLAGRIPAVTARARRAARPVETLLTRRLSFGSPVSDDVVAMVGRVVAQTPVATVAAFYPAFAGLDLYDAVPVLRGVATLILSAAGDRITPAWQSAEIAARLPDARVLELPDAGHLAFLEYPELVTGLLADLIDRAGARAS